MTDDELRLAAGALLAEIDAYARAYNRYEYGLPLDIEHMPELVAVVRPYLAGRGAVAADDGKLITPDWLGSQGWFRIGNTWYSPRDEKHAGAGLFWVSVDGSLRLIDLASDWKIPACTRGHVRHLIAALGGPAESRP